MIEVMPPPWVEVVRKCAMVLLLRLLLLEYYTIEWQKCKEYLDSSA